MCWNTRTYSDSSCQRYQLVLCDVTVRIANSDIKDKTSLVDARKSIEREMERFKACEKEAKTKAFSKAGLGLQAKLDPEEKAKQESRDWLNDQVEALQIQVNKIAKVSSRWLGQLFDLISVKVMYLRMVLLYNWVLGRLMNAYLLVNYMPFQVLLRMIRIALA